MNIHLARDGSALGIFTADEIRAGLASGRFRHDDLAWREGLPAWTALSSWPEFASVMPTTDAATGVALPPSELPWEVAPGLKTFFQSTWLILSRPAVLAQARLRAGSVFGAAYLAVAILFVPALLLSPLSMQEGEARTELIGQVFASSDNSEVAAAGRRMLESHQEAVPTLITMVCAWTCLLVIYPLFCAFVGVLLWPGLRLQGQKVAFGRLVMASTFTVPLIFLAFFPLTALLTAAGTAAPMLTLLPEILLGLVAFGFGCRAQGHALGLSGWRILLSHVMIASVLCLGCCCCSCLLGVMTGLGK